MYDLTGRVALVTGAGGRHGIGRAIALRLAQEGATLILSDLETDRTQLRRPELDAGWDGIRSVAEEVRAIGNQAISIHADLTDTAQVNRVVERGIEAFGRVDFLVNNAASPPGADRLPVVDVEEADFGKVLDINVKGTFVLSRAVGRHMIARGGGGKILMMSSTLGKQARARYAAYSASKFALIGFTQSLALELAPHQITVNALCPGPVDTERFDRVSTFSAAAAGKTPADFRAALLRDRAREAPLGRVATPSDVANVAAFLLSGEADYLTGLAINIAGGLEMR